jgi:hypothetical protein
MSERLTPMEGFSMKSPTGLAEGFWFFALSRWSHWCWGAIVIVLIWLFIIAALPLVRYVFHLSTLVKMVATLGILVMWFSTEVMRHGLQFAVARALNIAVVVCLGVTFASALDAIALIGEQIWAWLFVTNVEWAALISTKP